jgi:SSS family solute:Na+ symporter
VGLLDLAVLTVFLGATVWIGLSRSSGQTTVSDYFTTGRRAPWGMVMASIVATETSTVTLVSLPGFAFTNDLTFLQLVVGYLVGRAIVTALLIPAYFRGKYVTAYQVLTERFGRHVGRLAAAIFLGTRNLSDGFRLFGTGLVLGAVILTVPGAERVAGRLAPSIDPATTILVGSVILLGAVTIAYTYFGGMSAVLWTDALQLVVYIGGSLIAAVVLLQLIPGGWREVVDVGTAAGRFRVFDFSWDPTRSYTFWSGLIGGACLTVSTHGTDQLIVQRYLCSRSAREASRALMWSGVVVLGQFILFLLIGVMLYVYYTDYAPHALDRLSTDGQLRSDRIFPTFIVTQLPAGLRGLMVAAIFAAAMSTLSSSLNASASTTLADFYMPATGERRSARHYLRVARQSTMVWGVLQIMVAIAAIQFSGRIVDEVLGISSFTNGLILGVFLLGLAGYRRPSTAFAAIGTGATVMLSVRFLTGVSWQWYVLIGASATWTAGWLMARLTEDPHDG